MNQYLLLQRLSSATTWEVSGDFATAAEAVAAGKDAVKQQRAGEVAIAQIQLAYAAVVTVTLTQITL